MTKKIKFDEILNRRRKDTATWVADIGFKTMKDFETWKTFQEEEYFFTEEFCHKVSLVLTRPISVMSGGFVYAPYVPMHIAPGFSVSGSTMSSSIVEPVVETAVETPENSEEETQEDDTSGESSGPKKTRKNAKKQVQTDPTEE